MKTKKVEILPSANPNMLARKRTVKVAVPDSLEQALENLFLFDARCLDKQTRRELQRILPALIHVSRAWTARFAELGCVSCNRKRVSAGPGSFCQSCYSREKRRLREWYGKSSAGRDTAREMSSVTRKYDVAQMILNGDDE